MSPIISLALPKGRMQAGVLRLLSDAGIKVHASDRSYRPTVSWARCDCKIFKPQNIVEMLDVGSRDIGFAGADWVAELETDLVQLLDCELDPVRIVAAAPSSIMVAGRLPRRPLVVASEYRKLTQRWITRRELDARFVRSYGATEVFPPEDADCIVDAVLCSSPRLYANPRAMDDPDKRTLIDELTLLLTSVLSARQRVMVEVNVGAAALERVIEALPCMRQPTIAQLHADEGYAVKAAVPRDRLPKLVCELKARGATDIVVSKLAQIIA
jgi:ATP phosphoribosyltransferase